MYRFAFTSRMEDLLEAEKAERRTRVARPVFQITAVFIGIGLFASGMIAWQEGYRLEKAGVWLLLGSIIIYYFCVWPYKRRMMITKQNPPSRDVCVEFDSEGIRVHINGEGDFMRQWEELVEVIDTVNGVLFVFSDGAINWLPHRVFSDDTERRNFVEFVKEASACQGTS